ncbi:MAG: DUF2490 domain-containing protein [Chitinophagales bacterium]|nr:DUF2490 domain-containing protein [Chitinophagales bacterium]
MRKILSLAFLFTFLTHKNTAQNFDLGSWNILNLKYNYNDKISFFGEAQLRSLQFYSHFHYYEYKGGINYKIYKNVKLTIGAGSYQTYREGGDFVLPKNNDEFRLWPQITLFQSIAFLKIEQRYRTELRWTSNGYRNRFRYRLGISYPFGKDRKDYKPYQISVSNELFFSDNEPYFERNRLLFALNYKPIKSASIQIGYLHQFDYKIIDEIGRDFFMIGFYYDIFRKTSSNVEHENDIKDH